MAPRSLCPTSPPELLITAAVSPEELDRTLREAREGLRRLRQSLWTRPAPGTVPAVETRPVAPGPHSPGAPYARPTR